VNVYPISAHGDVAPIAAIAGSKTYFDFPIGIALDSDGNIYVTSVHGAAANSVEVFSARSNGNVSPTAVIQGSATELNYPMGVALDGNNNIYVSNYDGAPWVTVYTAGSTGNVAPTRTFPSQYVSGVEGIALDAKANIYVTSFGGPSTLGVVTVWPAGANGYAAPIMVINGPATGLTFPVGITLDAKGNIYVANQPFNRKQKPSVLVFSAGSNGDASPMRVITGAATQLNTPVGIALDAKENVYVGNFGDQGRKLDPSITVFAAGAKGNVAPVRVIKGNKSAIGLPEGIAIH
jgi:serine/threonine protein kinase, bacterial